VIGDYSGQMVNRVPRLMILADRYAVMSPVIANSDRSRTPQMKRLLSRLGAFRGYASGSGLARRRCGCGLVWQLQVQVSLRFQPQGQGHRESNGQR
jgi:hypothetical protein